MEVLTRGASGTQIPPLRRSKRVAAAAGGGAPYGAQIPFRRNRAAKRPRRALGDPRRGAPCSSVQIQSRGLKRKYFRTCPMSHANSSWGAKRARSSIGLGGGGKLAAAVSGRPLPPPRPNNNRCADLLDFCRELSWGAKRERGALAGGALPRPDNSVSCTTRDWANLGDGPAGLVAELALANDVADYIRFRAVCRPWRRCSPHPRAGGRLDGRFFPRRWIMLDKALAGPRCRCFLNVATGESIRTDLPELAEHWLLALTPEGLLLLLDRDTHLLRLLNPLTRQLADLPPVTALLRREQLGGGALGEDTVRVHGVGLVAGASTVAVAFSCPEALAVAKPGDESWTVLGKSGVIAALPFEGRLYCATYKGVMVLNISSDQQPPRLLMAAERGRLSYSSSMTDSLHLVDNGGELMLVHRMICRRDIGTRHQSYERRHVVYRVDLDAGILIPVKCFNGRAVFMGMTRAISVSPETFPLVTADTLYLGFDCDGDTLSYNLADGTRERRHRRTFLDPCSIVACFCYCIQGTGRKLA